MTTATDLLDSVLIVEPVSRIRHGLEVSLQQGGYRVIGDDGSDLVDKVQREVPDLVLLSCEVRDGDGDSFGLCRRLVQGGVVSALVMMHASPTKEMVIKAARAGAKGFVVTPAGGPKLYRKLESVYSQTPQAESRARFPIIRFGSRQLTNAQKVEVVMRDVASIRVMPQAVTKVLQVTAQDESGAQDIARAAGSDPTLAAMMLKRANSSYYGGDGPVNDIQSAVVRMGFKECRDLVLGMSVSSLFPKIEKSFGFNRVWYWVHSLACAMLAENIARRVAFQDKEDAFTAGLLHDIGKIILDDFLTSVYGQIVRLSHTSGITMCQAERDTLDHDHTAVGSKVAEKWKFPAPMCEAIVKHHDHQAVVANEQPDLTGVIYLADQLSKAILVGGGGDFIIDDIPPAVWERYHYYDVSLEPVLNLLYDELKEFCGFLQINDREVETALEHNTDSGMAVLYDPQHKNDFLLSVFLANQGFVVHRINEPQAVPQLQERPQLFLLRPTDLGDALVLFDRIQELPDGPVPSVCILEDPAPANRLQSERHWLRVVATPVDCFTLLCKARELLPEVLKAKVISHIR